MDPLGRSFTIVMTARRRMSFRISIGGGTSFELYSSLYGRGVLSTLSN
jgi:hypothetical protein